MWTQAGEIVGEQLRTDGGARPKAIGPNSTPEEVVAFRAWSKERYAQWQVGQAATVEQETTEFDRWAARLLTDLFVEAQWHVRDGCFADGLPLREQNEYRASLIGLLCDAITQRQMVAMYGGGESSGPDGGEARDMTPEETDRWLRDGHRSNSTST